MATKAFQGEIIRSEDASFTTEVGETVVGWRLVLMLTEELTKSFFISDRNPEFTNAKQFVKGEHVRVHANAESGRDNKVKWVAVQLEKIGQPEKKEPPF